jgi:riboflavin biosynthesis pyrimidine reductase
MFDDAELLARYTVADRGTRHVRVNFIASIDGAVTHGGLSGPLNDAADKQVFDVLRRLSDVVLLGAGTLRQEGYGGLRLDPAHVEWREVHGLAPNPVLAVVSARLDLDPAAAPFADAPARPVVLTHAGSPGDRRRELSTVADVVVAGTDRVDLAAALDALAGRGLTQVLCEGGPHLFGGLVAADLVDEMCLTVSPVLEGGDAGRATTGSAQATRPMRLAHAITAGDMVMLRYLRTR